MTPTDGAARFGSLSASELREIYRKGDASVAEVVESVLRDIERRNSALGAFTTVLYDEARAVAANLDAVRSNIDDMPLYGIPIGIKDLSDFKAGVRSTFGTALLSGYVPTTSSPHVERLEAAGAVVVGKTNVPEFGHKGVTDNRLIGPARLPSNPRYNAGGSSGGSATAVAAGMVPIAQGSDGGGSVRIPAALSGVVGIKPAFGRIPMRSRPNAFTGDRPFVSLGALSRDVADGALMVDVMSGRSSADPWTLDTDPQAAAAAAEAPGLKPLRAAYCRRFGTLPVARPVQAAIDASLGRMRSAGCEVDEVDLDLGASHVDLESVWLRQMGMSYLESIDALRTEGFDILAHRSELDAPLDEMICLGQEYDLRQLRADDVARTRVYDAFEEQLSTYDVLLSPTLSVPWVVNNEQGTTVGPSDVDGERVNSLIGWCLTYPVNFTGHPAASMPIPFLDDGNVGLQIIGRRHSDQDVVRYCALLESIFAP